MRERISNESHFQKTIEITGRLLEKNGFRQWRRKGYSWNSGMVQHIFLDRKDSNPASSWTLEIMTEKYHCTAIVGTVSQLQSCIDKANIDLTINF